MNSKVLYIMGFSRSGSTVLNTVLSNAADVFGAGELCNLVTAMAANEYCACGEHASECPFWREVQGEWTSRTDDLTAIEYLELQQSYGRYRSYWRGEWNDPALQRYLHATRLLYEAIREVSGCSWVIDSSKSPIRALILSRTPGIDVYVIHLVRDIRGVTYSRTKSYASDPKAGVAQAISGLAPRRIAARWMLCNAFANGVRKRLGKRSMLLRYEDFIAEPRAALQRISAFAGLDLGSLPQRLEDGADFSIGHTVAGNRMRMSGSIQLRQTIEWPGRISRFHHYTLPLLTWPVGRRYASDTRN